MDLSYATIPTMQGSHVILHKEPLRKQHIEYPQEQKNEIICFQYNVVSSTVEEFDTNNDKA